MYCRRISYPRIAQPRGVPDSDIPYTAECETRCDMILAQLSVLACCEYDPTNGIASIQCCVLTGCPIAQSRDPSVDWWPQLSIAIHSWHSPSKRTLWLVFFRHAQEPYESLEFMAN